MKTVLSRQSQKYLRAALSLLSLLFFFGLIPFLFSHIAYAESSHLAAPNRSLISARKMQRNFAANPEDQEISAAESSGPLDNRLNWTLNSSNQNVISLSEAEWELVDQILYNLMIDDGEGYIDLGMDAVFDFDSDGNLLAPQDRAWIAINNQPVAFYFDHTNVSDQGTEFVGYVPALLNDEYVYIVITFDSEHPDGAITGIWSNPPEADYSELPVDELEFWHTGDVVDFLADYYDYSGEYIDSFLLGESMTVTENMLVSYVYLPEGSLRESFRFTDLDQNIYWTPALYQ